jgi:hypothetical protein
MPGKNNGGLDIGTQIMVLLSLIYLWFETRASWWMFLLFFMIGWATNCYCIWRDRHYFREMQARSVDMEKVLQGLREATQQEEERLAKSRARRGNSE